MENLENKIAVVTGASSGIGRAIALSLAGHGAEVCLVGRRPEVLETVMENAGLRAPQMRRYQIDLTVDNDILHFKKYLEQTFGRVDILVHSAGTICLGELERLPVEEFDRQFSVNVRVPYLLTQVLLPMIKSCRGQVVFINSSAGLHAMPKVGQYAATKHALKAIADSLRKEVNADGIRVMSIFPGRTATPMQEKVHEMEGKTYDPDIFIRAQDVADVVINALLLPVTAEVTDLHIRPMAKAREHNG